jgi:hypothetical protein
MNKVKKSSNNNCNIPSLKHFTIDFYRISTVFYYASFWVQFALKNICQNIITLFLYYYYCCFESACRDMTACVLMCVSTRTLCMIKVMQDCFLLRFRSTAKQEDLQVSELQFSYFAVISKNMSRRWVRFIFPSFCLFKFPSDKVIEQLLTHMGKHQKYSKCEEANPGVQYFIVCSWAECCQGNRDLLMDWMDWWQSVPHIASFLNVPHFFYSIYNEDSDHQWVIICPG